MKKTYVEYSLPGSFFAESLVKEIHSRNVVDAMWKAPANAFAFSFYDVIVSNEDGIELRSNSINRSETYYFNAKELSISDVEVLNTNGQYDILLQNMESNDWPTIILCRTGNFQPKKDSDVLL